MTIIIERFGTPLRDWDIRINYGIKTGCNEAFIIDEQTRSELIAEDPKSAEIIRPILRGRDIKKDGYEWANLYLICTFPAAHIDIEKFPAVKNYFESGCWSNEIPDGYGKLKLEQTGQKHRIDGFEFTSRKKTSNKWFETQDQIAYMDDFDKQKILYSETNNSKETKIAFDVEKYMTDKTCFVLIGNNPEETKNIYNVMSSPIFTWYMSLTSPLLGSAGISMTKDSVLTFPIPKKMFVDIYESYGLTHDEKDFIENSLQN